MPRVALLYFINEQMYHYIIIIGLEFVFIWAILIKFALLLNRKDLKWKALLPWAIPGAIYSMLAKSFIVQSYFSTFILVILFIVITIVGKLSLLRAILSTIITFFFSALGFLLIGPFIHYNKNILVFFFQSPIGILVGGFFEVIFPLILLNILRYYNFSPAKKVRKSELFGILLLGVLLLTVYSFATQYVIFIVDASNRSFLSFFILELFLVILSLLIFSLRNQYARNEQQKQFQDQLKEQLEQSSALIETLSSEQREYRNQLQVIKALVDLGKKEKAVEYINKITNGLIDTSVVNFDNPILGSAILEEIIQARELGVEIKVKNDISLKDVANAFKIGKAIKIVINYFLYNPVMKSEKIKEILVSIEKAEDKYRFSVQYEYEGQMPEFISFKQTGCKQSGSKKIRFKQTDLNQIDSMQNREELKEAEDIIKDIYGDFSYGYHRDVLAKLSFRVPFVAEPLKRV